MEHFLTINRFINRYFSQPYLFTYLLVDDVGGIVRPDTACWWPAFAQHEALKSPRYSRGYVAGRGWAAGRPRLPVSAARCPGQAAPPRLTGCRQVGARARTARRAVYRVRQPGRPRGGWTVARMCGGDGRGLKSSRRSVLRRWIRTAGLDARTTAITSRSPETNKLLR